MAFVFRRVLNFSVYGSFIFLLKNFSSCHGCGVAENFITCWLILVCSCSLSAAHFWIQLDLMLVSYESLCRFFNRILNQMKV